MNKFKATWEEPIYRKAIKIVDQYFFTDDLGYDDEDRKEILKLKVGEKCIIWPDGCHYMLKELVNNR